MVLIIMDIGINHDGSMNLAHELIRQAAMNGADIAKFQAYSVDALFGPNGADPNEEIYNSVKPLEFNEEQFAQLNEWCKEEQIEFMCSVFDSERLEWMEKLKMKRHKIASRVSKLDHDLAQKIIDKGKETFVSYGMGGQGFDGKYRERLRSLYCVSNYPTEYKDLKLPEKFQGMASEFDSAGYWYGLSDHSIGIESSLVAVGRGALVVEKHFTLDKSSRGFDHICSIEPDELADLVKYAKLMGKVVKS